jgi:hypothetical protein
MKAAIEQEHNNSNSRERIADWFLAVAFMALGFYGLYALWVLGQMLEPLQPIIYGLSIAAILFLMLLRSPLRNIFFRNDDGAGWARKLLWAATFMWLGLGMLVGPNYFLSPSKHRNAEYQVLSKNHSSGTSKVPESWTILIKLKNGVETSLGVSELVWQKIVPGSQVKMVVHTGALGYEYVLKCLTIECSSE